MILQPEFEYKNLQIFLLLVPIQAYPLHSIYNQLMEQRQLDDGGRNECQGRAVYNKSRKICKSKRSRQSQDKKRNGQTQKLIQKINDSYFDGYGFRINPIASISEVQNIFEDIYQFSRQPLSEYGTNLWNLLLKELESEPNSQLFVVQKENSYFLINLVSRSIIKEISYEDLQILEGVYLVLDKMKKGVMEDPSIEDMAADELRDADQKVQEVRKQLVQGQAGPSKQMSARPLSILLNQYWTILARKVFSAAFSDQQIDELNYFKLQEHTEGHSNSFSPIKNEEECRKFVNKRRNKLRKSQVYLLHVACQSCLSPHYDPTNPLILCKQCHCRYHEMCLDLSKVERCGRCIYSRLNTNTKHSIPECYLCGVTGLGPIRINNSRFAHIFCLMINRLWKLQNIKIKFSQESSTSQLQLSDKQCQICKKQSNRRLIFSCTRCDKLMHPLCGFMQGCIISMQKQTFRLQCCESSQKMEDLKKRRRFILNYDKCVYKQFDPKRYMKSSRVKQRKNSIKG